MKFAKVYPLLSKNDFLLKAKKVGRFTSSRGKRYKVKYVEEDVLHFTRLDANKDIDWSLDLNDVYRAYSELEKFDTIQFKKYIPVRHSPARGLLLCLELIK